MAEEEAEYCLFSWGANSYGQLGLGHKEDTLLPCKGQIPSSIAHKLSSIRGGGGHTVLLTDNGVVYVCGWNKNGQCGLPSPTGPDMTIPQPLANFSSALRIAKVSCGWNHTLALTAEHGNVFVWGSNAFGQLGLTNTSKQSNIPTVLPSQLLGDVPACDIAAGLRHSLAVTVDGKVYSWGDDKKRQLGHGGVDSGVCQNSPKCVVALQSVRCKRVAAGAYHSIFITDEGSLYACGLNQHGQCGVSLAMARNGSLDPNLVKLSPDSSTISNVYVPLKVEGLPPVTEVCCGWSHNMAISVNQEVYTWGRADYGQLGREISKRESDCTITTPTCTADRANFCSIPTAIPQLKSIKQIFCGSEHNILLSDDNEVITFGWNEHGMCATGDENNVYSPHVLTAESLKGWTPLLVGGGAGHSMIVACRTLR